MVTIVGAGLTGLALLHALRGRGVDALVLEAEARVGGAIRSLRHGAWILEAGPQRLRLSPPVRALVDELGLRARLLQAEPDLPLFVHARGALREVPRSPAALLATSLLTWPAKLRLLREPLAPGPRPGDSAADYLRRRLGDQAYRDVAGPLFGGLYGTDPADMRAADALLPLLRDLGAGVGSLLAAFLRAGRAARRGAGPGVGARAASFRDGLAELPEALRAAHADRVRLGARVRSVRPRGAGWVVETADERVDSDVVVLTVPAPAAARILRRAAPDAAGRLAALRQNTITVAFLEADGLPRGLGYQVAFGDRGEGEGGGGGGGNCELRGVTFNACLFPGGVGRDRLCTAFLGAFGDDGVDGLPDDWIGEVACNELARATGAQARPIRVERATMPAWDASWARLDGLALPDGIVLAANYESRAGIGGRVARAAEIAELLESKSKSRSRSKSES